VTRRRKEPEARELVRFIAEHESLSLTLDEFPSLTEDRLREILKSYARPPESAAKQSRVERRRRRAADARDGLNVEVFTDGASRGNPGQAGAGWVILSASGETIKEGYVYLGRRTNNEAEYEAVIHALNDAESLGARTVALRTDSQLLVRQINGQYRVKSARLEHLHRAAREVIQRFRRFEANHIPREENGDADALANKAIDESADASGEVARR
jgi:ribonuclease HI